MAGEQGESGALPSVIPPPETHAPLLTEAPKTPLSEREEPATVPSAVEIAHRKLIEQIRQAWVPSKDPSKTLVILPDGTPLTDPSPNLLEGFGHVIPGLPPVEEWIQAGVIRVAHTGPSLLPDTLYLQFQEEVLSEAQLRTLIPLIHDSNRVVSDIGSAVKPLYMNQDTPAIALMRFQHFQRSPYWVSLHRPPLAPSPAAAPKPAEAPVAAEAAPPALVYHGTPSVFEKFDPVRNDPSALYGPGIYFTDSPDVARGYSQLSQRGETSAFKVYPVELKIKKVFDVDAVPDKALANKVQELIDAQLPNYGGEKATSVTTNRRLYHLLLELTHSKEGINGWLFDNGYDAITHIGGRRMGVTPHRVWIVLGNTVDEVSTRIKPAFGRATLEPMVSPVAAEAAPGATLPPGVESQINMLSGTPFDIKEGKAISGIVGRLRQATGVGKELEDAAQSWAMSSRGLSGAESIRRLGMLAEAHPQFLEGIHALLRRWFPYGYIRVFRAPGFAVAGRHNFLERPYTNVTTELEMAKLIAHGQPLVLEDVLISVDDVVNLGTLTEFELIIPSGVLRERIVHPITSRFASGATLPDGSGAVPPPVTVQKSLFARIKSLFQRKGK